LSQRERGRYIFEQAVARYYCDLEQRTGQSEEREKGKKNGRIGSLVFGGGWWWWRVECQGYGLGPMADSPEGLMWGLSWREREREEECFHPQTSSSDRLRLAEALGKRQRRRRRRRT